mmetsp:Transcript_24033/g.54354  ORF Transcript_24033/g.54354 Transcript_24033/m.54354 type:complete len:243 (-) Transcript_24033:21-749(-)
MVERGYPAARAEHVPRHPRVEPVLREGATVARVLHIAALVLLGPDGRHLGGRILLEVLLEPLATLEELEVLQRHTKMHVLFQAADAAVAVPGHQMPRRTDTKAHLSAMAAPRVCLVLGGQARDAAPPPQPRHVPDGGEEEEHARLLGRCGQDHRVQPVLHKSDECVLQSSQRSLRICRHAMESVPEDRDGVCYFISRILPGLCYFISRVLSAFRQLLCGAFLEAHDCWRIASSPTLRVHSRG